MIFNRFEDFPTTHRVITPSDSNFLPSKGMIIYCVTAGNIAVEDKNGNVITYAVPANHILPVLAYKVRSTNTTVSTIIGLV